MPAYRTRPAGRTWQRRQPRATDQREEIQYAKDSERMAHIIAGMFCGSCGTTADAEGKHAPDCIDVPAERRRSR